MEFWEGAILVVGGVWLVAHMANKNKQAQQTVIGTSTLGAAGTSNQSNLTNLTNTAGGQPTVYGEPLEPSFPPLGVPFKPPLQLPPGNIRVAYPIMSTGVFSAKVPTSTPGSGPSPVHMMML